ncbi:hypothetical protein QE152_g10004 [Popillia japonica]|uniref:Uncharacterized protein n=1 Tax=Popillia japonica TaxID=7064 RepID=A0AAW1LWA7_POPJA
MRMATAAPGQIARAFTYYTTIYYTNQESAGVLHNLLYKPGLLYKPTLLTSGSISTSDKTISTVSTAVK